MQYLHHYRDARSWQQGESNRSREHFAHEGFELPLSAACNATDTGGGNWVGFAQAASAKTKGVGTHRRQSRLQGTQ